MPRSSNLNLVIVSPAIIKSSRNCKIGLITVTPNVNVVIRVTKIEIININPAILKEKANNSSFTAREGTGNRERGTEKSVV
jgi:hypothetical protein